MNQHDLLFLGLAALIILAALQLQISADLVPSALLLGTTGLTTLVHISGVTLRARAVIAWQLLLAVLCTGLTLLSVLSRWQATAEYLVWGMTGLPLLLVQLLGLLSGQCSDKIPGDLP